MFTSTQIIGSYILIGEIFILALKFHTSFVRFTCLKPLQQAVGMHNTILKSLLLQAQNANWIHCAWILTVTTLLLLLARSTQQVPFPKSAPQLIKGNWPIVGALRFFTSRGPFLKEGASITKTGNFSFYCGKHRVVGLSGIDGRKTFYESKDLSSHQGQVGFPQAGGEHIFMWHPTNSNDFL